MEWDLLRTFEAVARHGGLSAAARALGVSQSTVSRQIARLEASAASPLLVRANPVRLTERGAALLAATRPMLGAALAAASALDETPEVAGLVTVTTVGELARWVLVPRLPELFAAHPQLSLRILVDNRLHSLAAGDADIALRMARPARGDLVACALTVEAYGLFAAETLTLGPETPWLGLAGSLAEIPEQRAAAKLFAGRPPRLRVEDVEALGLAVRAGLGVAVLPRRLAERLGVVREVPPAAVGARGRAEVAPRKVWMVLHRARKDLPRIRAVVGWLTGLEPAASGRGLRRPARP